MENVEETDNITKNIVHEIVRECTSKNVEVDEHFCAYYVKLLTLDPVWRISPERKINRENIQSLVTFLIEKFQNQICPSLVTMKMQQYFLANVQGKTLMIDSHEQIMCNCVEPLLYDILNFVPDESNKPLENRFIRRVVMYITLLSGLGNPSHLPVIREATFALKSIFDENDVADFCELRQEEKQNQLLHFQNIVTGIRLFNRDCGRPAAEIEDLPKILAQAINATHSELQNELLRVMEKVNLATSALENVYVKEVRTNTRFSKTDNHEYFFYYELNLCLPEGINEDDVRHITEILVLARQYEVYIRKLLTDVQEIETTAKDLFNNLQNTFVKLHGVVKFKVAIPINVVFPLFLELAAIWKKIQDEAIILSLYNQIYQKVYKLVRSQKYDEEKIRTMIGAGEVFTDAMRLEKTMGLKINQDDNLCEVLDPLRIKDFDKIPLQFLGFCAWSVVKTGGGLIPGNPNMGICRWKDKYYVFSSLESAADFGHDPERFVLQALEIARQKPELINLLQLHDQICALREVGVLYEKPAEVVMTCHENIQTEVHPIESNIDPNYIWNIWDYYRWAIKLANICKCQTHSTQSLRSHFRYPVFVQTTEPRDKNLQTKTDNYINVATPSNFLFGLRGRKDDMQHIVDLTRPIDEEEYWKCATAMENPPLFQMKFRKFRKQVPMQKSVSEVKLPKEEPGCKCKSEKMKNWGQFKISTGDVEELSHLLDSLIVKKIGSKPAAPKK